MNYTQTIGDINELKCLISFIELGYECSIPYGNGARYDFIADIDGRLLRIQCKSAHWTNDHGTVRDDAFSLSLVSSTTNTKETIRYEYTQDQIDYFATHFNGKTYIIPVNEASQSKTLRFSPPANGNKNYNKAEDYEISKFFAESPSLIKSREDYFNRSISTSQGLQRIGEVKKYYCIDCGKEITQGAIRCSECSQKAQRKCERPSREELKSLIRNTSFTAIGKSYEVSDKTISKWCKAYNLPSKKSDINSISDSDWQTI